MGVCETKPQQAKLIIELSTINQETEKGLVERLKESLMQKGVSIEILPASINKDLLYMKMVYQRRGTSMTLASGTSEVTPEQIERIAEEISKKIKEQDKN